jgi:4-amino-4-deoxy-L-arabinose transferase-like glycosyltransferase
MFSKKRIGIFVFLSTFLVGVLSSYFYYNELPIGDATYYFNAASLIKENITYLLISPRIGVVESFNAIIQGLLFFLPGSDFFNVYVLQIIIYSLTGLFIYKLAEKFIGRLGGLITFGFYLINYNNWLYIYNFKPGVWVNFILILTVYCSYLVFQKPDKLKNYLLTSVFSALLLLTDLRYLPHLMFIYFMFLFTHTAVLVKIKNIFFSAAVIILLISPWIIRQSLVFDKFVFISDLNTVTINGVFNTERYQSLSNNTDALVQLSEEDFNERFWELSDSLNLTPGEMIYARAEAKKTIINNHNIQLKEKYAKLISDKVFTEEQIASIIQKEESHPGWIKRLKRAAYLWAPFKMKYSYDPLSTYKNFIPPASKTNNLNRFLTLGILLPFLLFGIFFLFKEKNIFGITLTGIFIIHTLIHILTYVQWRYMLPVLPLITLVSIFGAMKISKYSFTKNS